MHRKNVVELARYAQLLKDVTPEKRLQLVKAYAKTKPKADRFEPYFYGNNTDDLEKVRNDLIRASQEYDKDVKLMRVVSGFVVGIVFLLIGYFLFRVLG
jgi:hypothetical protein